MLSSQCLVHLLLVCDAYYFMTVCLGIIGHDLRVDMFSEYDRATIYGYSRL